MTKKKQLNFYISDEGGELLTELSHRFGLSKTGVIEQALRVFEEVQNSGVREASKKSRKISRNSIDK